MAEIPSHLINEHVNNKMFFVSLQRSSVYHTYTEH